MVRVLIPKTKTLSPLRLVSLHFPFQGSECGILWAERQISFYLHSLVGVILIKPTNRDSPLLWREEVRIRSLSNTNIAVFPIRALNQPFKLFPKFSARHTFTDQGWRTNHLPPTIELVSARHGSESVLRVNGVRLLPHVFWVRRMRLIV